jgi:organic radical activating enzyme
MILLGVFMKLFNNCCDGIYNSFDVHFTGTCDNKCAHCIDMRFHGVGETVPNVKNITDTIIKNKNGLDDVLFLGGEPCLYIEELIECIKILRADTDLKLFVTTSVPKVCFDKRELFCELIGLLDGINLSVQHHDESVADGIRRTTSTYDRQSFYNSLPSKDKIRINLNIVKPYLYTREDISDCLRHYDGMGFNSIKLSEIQHGEKVYVSFSDVFGIEMKSAYSNGCQTYLDVEKLLPGFTTPVLLKRSCFICEKSLTASLTDGIKAIAKMFTPTRNKYGVVYENGKLEKGWV